MILGTAAYMAPEQARGKAVDKRADIWAFGVVLWEMLTGERLFEGETLSDTLAAVLTKEVDGSQLPAVDAVWRSGTCCAAASSATRRGGCVTSARRGSCSATPPESPRLRQRALRGVRADLPRRLPLLRFSAPPSSGWPGLSGRGRWSSGP